MVTAERLRQLFKYDPETGLFERAGRLRNGTNTVGYVQFMIDGEMQLGHRMAWLYVHGSLPNQIDHINGVRHDNRICNLRESSQAQNCGNVRRHRDNKSGFKGVIRSSDGKRWAAQICKDGLRRHLGTFDTPEDAHAAYCEAAKAAFGEFARAA
jgi:hypothetical protein